MNFRLTRGKVIWNIVIAIILFFIPILFFNRTNTGSIQNILSLIDLSRPLSSGNIFLFLIVFIIIYIIISLFQRKKI